MQNSNNSQTPWNRLKNDTSFSRNISPAKINTPRSPKHNTTKNVILQNNITQWNRLENDMSRNINTSTNNTPRPPENTTTTDKISSSQNNNTSQNSTTFRSPRNTTTKDVILQNNITQCNRLENNWFPIDTRIYRHVVLPNLRSQTPLLRK